MSLINLGSKVAFEAMLSLATVALMATYLMSIGCVLLKRLRGEELPPARWSLGRYGLAVNAVALLYTSWSVSRLPNRLLAFVSCQLMLSSVLLGLLADYLPHSIGHVRYSSYFLGVRSWHIAFMARTPTKDR
jgi:amino acid transporter